MPPTEFINLRTTTPLVLFSLFSLFLFTPCQSATNLNARVTVNFTNHIGTTSHKMFGTVDTNLNPSTNNGPKLMEIMADMDVEFIRVVDQNVPLLWTDSVHQNWSVTAINTYFNGIKTAYTNAGKPTPEFIVTIKQWPQWLWSGNVLPQELNGNYSEFCADLVQIINLDLGLDVIYWQPFNNLDTPYASAGRMGDLYLLYDMAAAAMKAVDPRIKVGPSFSALSVTFMETLLASSMNVDWMNVHFYLTPNLTTKTTDQIFLEGQVSTRYRNYFEAVGSSLDVIMDEYALHYNSAVIDPRVTNNIAAVWFATMHLFIATEPTLKAANNYNIRSNYIGLIDNTNSERPSASIFRWSNQYFVGNMCSSVSDYGMLQVMAVQNGDVYALYVINTYSNDTTFTFQNVTGLNDSFDSFVFVKNTVNSSGVYEDEVTGEWVGLKGTHTIPAYTVFVLYYNVSDPQQVPTSAPTAAPTDPPGYTCSIVNGARICTQDYTVASFNVGLSAGLGAFVGVGVLVGLFAVVILWAHFASFRKKYGTFYCGVILSGVMISYAGALTLLPRPTDSLCVAFPWLIGIAFTLVYGCIFIKAWILYSIWRHAMQLKRTSITALTVIKYVGVALSIEIAFLIIWTIIDPPTVHNIKMVNHTIQGQCQSDRPIFWIVFIAMKGAWLLFGAGISVLTRDVIKEYNDFAAIAYAIYNNVILIVIAIPLAIVLETVPDGTMIICVLVVVLAFTFTTIILFFETWLSVLFPNTKFPALGPMSGRARGSPASTTASSNAHSSHSGSGGGSPAHSGSGSGSVGSASASD